MAGSTGCTEALKNMAGGRLWAESDGGQLGSLWQMLRCAHIDMRGGLQSFAALCAEVRCADKPDLCSRG
jgi:hypothetical protein